MPLVSALWAEIMDSLGWPLGYAPSEVALIPEECEGVISGRHMWSGVCLPTDLDGPGNEWTT